MFRLFARPRYVPAVPLGFPVPSDPFLARSLSQANSPLHRVLGTSVILVVSRVVSRGIREPSGVEGGAQQPRPAVPEIPVHHNPSRVIWITSADWPPDGTDRVNWVSRDIDQG